MDFAIAYDSEVALAVITLHGLVDLAEGWVGVVLTYVLVSAPLVAVSFLITPLFFLASILHFRHDVGTLLSLELHSVMGGFVWYDNGDPRRASKLLFAYLLTIHIPKLYWRLVKQRRKKEHFLALLMGLAVMYPTKINDLVYDINAERTLFTLTPLHQLLVICHVFVHERVGSLTAVRGRQPM